MYLKHVQEIRWLCSCLIFLCWSCSSKKAADEKIGTSKPAMAISDIDIAKVDSFRMLVHTGDVVTRTGNDFTSQSLKKLNRRDTRFSHIGIASVEHDTVFVYHALGGEWNPDELLRREPVSSFLSPVENKGGALFTLNIPAPAKQFIARTANTFYHNKLKFDMKFDLATDERMYCAEFVAKTIELATGGKLRFNRSKINQFTFIGVDDIFLHTAITEVKTITFR